MPVARMRMRPWLEQMIDSNKIPGLNWVDMDRTMFTIPWKHAARHGWEMDKDACLFKEWAIHTGKYNKGQSCDPKTWKANFRCAMNSLPDIEEVKDQSINKGHLAKRVFRMLPVTQKSRDKRSKARETRKKIKCEDDSDYSDTHSPANKSMLGDLSSSEEGSVDLEVPDFPTVEIKAESSLNSNYRFEVSPVHSNEDEFDDIIEICKQLERDDHPSYAAFPRLSYASPEQTWSDSSSDTETTPEYMTLGGDFSLFSSNLDNMWTSYMQNPI